MSEIRIPFILVADDDAEDRMLVKEAFEEANGPGHIRFVNDGEELLHYLQHTGKFSDQEKYPSPQLILLDLNMPRKDGKEALTEIKAAEHLRGIPVVVLTTCVAEQEVRAIYALGANSFIVKPTSYTGLVKIMKSLCAYWFRTVLLPDTNSCKLLLQE
ncbi:response regulator [Pontibacter beigongshangensis]|uniref:response regulator n=1 Tax=Pontibacter beigongshangensis TaxID=2574733 RepID=UPI00164FAC2B|nr:response regulator [Pontibacter beigongshangensis]